MHKNRDYFDLLHDEERTHNRRFQWGGLSEEECGPTTHQSNEPGHGDWAMALTDALNKHVEILAVRQKALLRLEILEGQIRSLAAKIAEIEKRSCRIPLTTFGHEPFDLMKTIEVVIECLGEEDYVATFFDANINASGCNPNNAFANLAQTIVARFNTLDSLPPEKLGKLPKKQLFVFREFMRRRP